MFEYSGSKIAYTVNAEWAMIKAHMTDHDTHLLFPGCGGSRQYQECWGKYMFVYAFTPKGHLV